MFRTEDDIGVDGVLRGHCDGTVTWPTRTAARAKDVTSVPRLTMPFSHLFSKGLC